MKYRDWLDVWFANYIKPSSKAKMCERYSEIIEKHLSESSQGLGFSNLIYLHLRLEEYLKSVDRYKVNVFFVEEPEAHMHPQMQNIFIRYLKRT